VPVCWESTQRLKGPVHFGKGIDGLQSEHKGNSIGVDFDGCVLLEATKVIVEFSLDLFKIITLVLNYTPDCRKRC